LILTSFIFPNAETVSAVNSALYSKLDIAYNLETEAVQNIDGSYTFFVPQEWSDIVANLDIMESLYLHNKDKITTYANKKLNQFLSKTRTYILPSNVIIDCDTNQNTLTSLTKLGTWGSKNLSSTTNWIDNSNKVTKILGSDAVALDQAVSDYSFLVWDTYGNVLLGIQEGNILSNSQIDTFFSGL
jgi:hypothetical protein